MITYRTLMKLVVMVAAAGAGLAADAAPVVYTLRTVADGQLGKWTFTQALVTFRMVSTTGRVELQAGQNGGIVYTNSRGVATVTVDDGYRVTVARFAPGEVYVRYDIYAGVVGFGSPLSPTYPVALGCADIVDVVNTNDCVQGDWTTGPLGAITPVGPHDGTVQALADVASIPADSVFVTTAALSLPSSLSQSTLLTGRAHACATAYTIASANLPDYLTTCPSPASRGLVTNKGDFFMQDRFGVNFGTEENTGALRVEVLNDDGGSKDDQLMDE